MIIRLFHPREVVNSDGAAVPANWNITNQTRANAMAYFLLCEGESMQRCTTCDHPNSLGPFWPCLVPNV